MRVHDSAKGIFSGSRDHGHTRPRKKNLRGHVSRDSPGNMLVKFGVCCVRHFSIM